MACEVNLTMLGIIAVAVYEIITFFSLKPVYYKYVTADLFPKHEF